MRKAASGHELPSATLVGYSLLPPTADINDGRRHGLLRQCQPQTLGSNADDTLRDNIQHRLNSPPPFSVFAWIVIYFVLSEATCASLVHYSQHTIPCYEFAEPLLPSSPSSD
jgi:hypothetical protein